MAGLVAFGEIMMRLATPGHERIIQASRLEVTYAGAEANVAVSVAALGHKAAVVTTLPTGPLGDAAVASLRYYGVDVTFICRTPQGRIGIYFLETGASQRPSRVIYDRADSAIALAPPSTYDWPRILRDRQALHTTGITPALGPSCATAAREALASARRLGLLTSLDLNYRAKLWSRDRARETIQPLLQDVDLVIANEEDADAVLGIQADKTDVGRGVIDRQGYEGVTRKIQEHYGVRRVAITLRESESATINHWSACLLDQDQFLTSRRYTIHVVDRVGAGDAFAGGLIAGLLENMPAQDALELAVAASCLKHTIPGDFNKVSREEILRLCQGDA
jgi:2-dehydro-3-deoxygluconokinase